MICPLLIVELAETFQELMNELISIAIALLVLEKIVCFFVLDSSVSPYKKNSPKPNNAQINI